MIRGAVGGVLFGGSGSAGVAPFSYETEADTFFAAARAAGVDPTTARKRTYNKLIKRLKDKGVWSRITNLYLLAGATEAITLINVKNPGTYNLTKVGSPTFVANSHWVTAQGSTVNYLDTTMPLNTISTNNHSFGLYMPVGNGTGGSDMGAGDSTKGLLINPLFGGAIIVKAIGTSVTFGSTADSDGSGFFSVSRDNSANFTVNRRGYNFTTQTSASNASSVSTTITLLKANGGQTSGRQHAMDFLGISMTEKQQRDLYAAFMEYYEAVLYGEFYEEQPNTGTLTITADVVVYGSTSGGIIAAYEAARQGKSVAICGGWRDRRPGGMSAGGLGFIDFNNHASLGGLSRWVLTKINALYGRADTTFQFESQMFSRVMRFLLDPSKNGGYTIPVYYTKGVNSVSKSGTEITRITTSDGRTFNGRQFIDCSYEGDLMRSAGVTVTKGREAAGASRESLNGFRGIITGAGGDNHQLKAGTTLINVDPYVVPGDSSSGLLWGISRTYGVDTPSNGTADDQIQSYNFRVTVTNNPLLMVPFPSTPPVGYDASHYEPLGRLMAQAPGTVTITNILSIDNVGTANIFDVNSRHGWSTDYWGASKDYPSASYAQREDIWKAHWNRILGLFYYLQYDPDTRVTATVRNAALAYGLCSTHAVDGVHEYDDPFAAPQLYVRECWRMVSDVVWTGTDIEPGTDGGTPRSVKTIATASYAMDSHSTEALADPNGGTPRIWLSGNFEYTLSGDETAPIPYDIIIPPAAECTNLLVPFAVSSTHVAFGAIRMELSFMQVAQSAALAATLAIDNSVYVQSIDYSTLRTELLASPTLSGEVAPVLPQVN